MGQLWRQRVVSGGLRLLGIVLLVVAGIGVVAPVGVQAAGTQTFTCTNGTFSSATFQTYLNAGGTIRYTGSTPCTITLTESLTITSSQAVEIDGGVGLTISGGTSQSPGGFHLIEIPGSTALTLANVTLEYGASAINNAFSARVKLVDSEISGFTGGWVINADSVELIDSTISGASAESSGGNYMYVVWANSATLINSTISGISANENGQVLGIYAVTDVKLANSSVRMLSAGDNGTAIGIESLGSVELTDSTIDGISAGAGIATSSLSSGIEADSGLVTLINSTISGISAGDSGTSDGLYCGSATLAGSTISDITAGDHGVAYGIEASNSVALTDTTISEILSGDGGTTVGTLADTAVSADSTISGITAGGSGNSYGIIGNTDISLIFSTIYGVTAGDNGFSFGLYASTLSLTASILAASGANCTGTVADGGYNLSTDASCGFGNPETSGTGSRDNVTGLNLQALGNYGGPTETVALGPGSVAIDAIPIYQGQCTLKSGQSGPILDPITSPATPITTDQRGVTRPQGAGCDVGAYEATASVTPLPGSTVKMRPGFFALIRVEALSPAGQNISSRKLPVTSVELDGPNSQVIPFAHRFQFGRFGRTSGYQLSINTRNLAPGTWTLVVQIGKGSSASTDKVTFMVR